MESLKRLDRLVREGKGGEASAEIARLAQRKVPHAAQAELANLAWRAGLPALGIRILHSAVRPPERSPREATSKEKAEYAACLIKLGALEEGVELLSSVPSR